MPQITILLGWWRGWRDFYHAEHVRAASRQLRAYIKIPFRLALLTDEPVTASECEVDEVYPGTADPEGLKLWQSKVNCFRRLRYFDSEYTKQFGTPWVASIDMDVLIRSDITDILTFAMHDFGFCINRAKLGTNRRYSGAFYAIKVGEHQYVWDNFKPEESPRECSATKLIGSDQTWIAMQIQDAPTVGREHGIYYLGEYRARDHVKDGRQVRLVNFSGNAKPWSRICLKQAPDLFREYVQWMDVKPVYAKSV